MHSYGNMGQSFDHISYIKHTLTNANSNSNEYKLKRFRIDIYMRFNAKVWDGSTFKSFI